MLKHRVLLAVLVVVALLSACEMNGTFIGSGRMATQKVDASNFDRVQAGGAFTVNIRQAESYSVVVRIDDNLVQCLDAYAQGSTLHLGLKPECWVTNVTIMEADITMPELTGVDLSGASRATIRGFKSSRNLDVELSGASSLDGDVDTGNVRIDISGASHATLTGAGGNLNAEASGASEIDLGNFAVQDASVKLSGASSATVSLSGRIDLEASGASHLHYRGYPTMGRIDLSGASSIDQE